MVWYRWFSPPLAIDPMAIVGSCQLIFDSIVDLVVELMIDLNRNRNIVSQFVRPFRPWLFGYILPFFGGFSVKAHCLPLLRDTLAVGY